MIPIQKIQLPVPGMDRLRSEAKEECYDFLETLVEDWESGTNRFDAAGETLMARLEEGLVIAVGGLNCDPFAGSPDMGRIRRVYVMKTWRNQGIGGALVTALVHEARAHFRCVRLRAENARAARLYESMGFAATPGPDATHTLFFD